MAFHCVIDVIQSTTDFTTWMDGMDGWIRDVWIRDGWIPAFEKQG